MIDWDRCISIESDAKIEDIENHFRVFAGPGAGKTFWLVQHIKNVLRKSKRLGRTGKIACITYTNNAVDEIYKQLRQSGDRVEVSTIHSFLYKNVLKPYGFLLGDAGEECPINLKLLIWLFVSIRERVAGPSALKGLLFFYATVLPGRDGIVYDGCSC